MLVQSWGHQPSKTDSCISHKLKAPTMLRLAILRQLGRANQWRLWERKLGLHRAATRQATRLSFWDLLYNISNILGPLASPYQYRDCSEYKLRIHRSSFSRYRSACAFWESLRPGASWEGKPPWSSWRAGEKLDYFYFWLILVDLFLPIPPNMLS